MKTKHYLIVVMMMVSSCLSAQTFDVSLKVYLEGPYSGTEMNTSLNSGNCLPLAQPYNYAPWNYSGTESVAAIPTADVVDWVLIELRETAGDASTAYKENTIASQAGFILKNGLVVAIDGANPLQFNYAVTYKLYAVVYHRNHLPVLSGGQLILIAGTYSWDYTTGAGQAYGGSNAHKEIAGGIWGMISGDGNADGQVNNGDKNDVWKPQSGTSGYKAGDFTMNGQVDNVDKNDYWKPNSGKSSQVPGIWSCGKPITDTRDGQNYPSVQIGTQCWLARNMNIGAMIPGANSQQNDGTIEKYCHGNSSANCDMYGGLYQWNEMMQYVTTPATKGICFDGWHLPTDAEWCTLEQYVDPTITCGSTGWRGVNGGGKLKETGTSHWTTPNAGATNSSGFTALPGGFRDANGNFNSLAYTGDFWSSDENGSAAWYRGLSYTLPQVYRYYCNKGYGFSVRCIQD